MKSICAVVLRLFFLMIVLFACKEEPPVKPPPVEPDGTKNTIILSVEWTDLYRINLKWNKAEEDTLNTFHYDLIRKDEAGTEVTKVFYLFGADTTYTDDNDGDSLATGTNYSYRIKAYNDNNELKDTSLTVITQTLSPTSHNISWQIDTLGQPGNFLYDVWGLDENNVWAIGYVDLPEGGSGIIKWNGTKWRTFPTFAGIKQGIFGFDENNIFVVGEFGAYGVVGIWDGGVWNVRNFFYDPIANDTVWALRGIWGNAPNDVWAVGDQGTIIHWDGIEWNKTNLGITTKITAIWGKSSNEIYLVPISGVRSSFYKFNGSEWNKIYDDIGIFSTTLWSALSGNLIIGGTSLLEYDGSSLQQVYIPGRTRGIVKVRGSNINNIFTAGDFGEITHFNGISWQDIDDFEVPNGRYRILYSVWSSQHKVFIVGVDENRAITIIGTIN